MKSSLSLLIVFLLLTSLSYSQEAKPKASQTYDPCEDSVLVDLELRYSFFPDSLSYDEKIKLRRLQKECEDFQKEESEYKQEQKDYRDKMADSYDRAVSGMNAYLIISAILGIICVIYLLSL